MHFCVILKTAELKGEKKKKTTMSNLFIAVSVLLENPVFQMYFVYTMLYITEVHSFLVQYCT